MTFSAAEDGIRSYGPGKYYTVIDGYTHEVTLDGGTDEEASYGEGDGWYGLLWIDEGTQSRIREIAREHEDELTEEEEGLLKDSKAVILFERSDGIVEATWFDSEEEAEKEWANILVDTEEEEENEEEESE